MAYTDTGKRKAKAGETPSPMDYKKLNMGERPVTEVETLSGAVVLFSEEAMTIIETEGKVTDNYWK